MSNYLRHAPLLGTALVVALMGGTPLALYEVGSSQKAVASTSISNLDSAQQISLAQGELPALLSGLSVGTPGLAAVKKSLANIAAVALVNKSSYSKASASYAPWAKLYNDSIYFSQVIAKRGLPSRLSNFGGIYTTLEGDILALK